MVAASTVEQHPQQQQHASTTAAPTKLAPANTGRRKQTSNRSAGCNQHNLPDELQEIEAYLASQLSSSSSQGQAALTTHTSRSRLPMPWEAGYTSDGDAAVCKVVSCNQPVSRLGMGSADGTAREVDYSQEASGTYRSMAPPRPVSKPSAGMTCQRGKAGSSKGAAGTGKAAKQPPVMQAGALRKFLCKPSGSQASQAGVSYDVADDSPTDTHFTHPSPRFDLSVHHLRNSRADHAQAACEEGKGTTCQHSSQEQPDRQHDASSSGDQTAHLGSCEDLCSPAKKPCTPQSKRQQAEHASFSPATGSSQLRHDGLVQQQQRSSSAALPTWMDDQHAVVTTDAQTTLATDDGRRVGQTPHVVKSLFHSKTSAIELEGDDIQGVSKTELQGKCPRGTARAVGGVQPKTATVSAAVELVDLCDSPSPAGKQPQLHRPAAILAADRQLKKVPVVDLTL